MRDSVVSESEPCLFLGAKVATEYGDGMDLSGFEPETFSLQTRRATVALQALAIECAQFLYNISSMPLHSRIAFEKRELSDVATCSTINIPLNSFLI